VDREAAGRGPNPEGSPSGLIRAPHKKLVEKIAPTEMKARSFAQKSGAPLIQTGLQPGHTGIGKSQNRFNGLLLFPQQNSVV